MSPGRGEPGVIRSLYHTVHTVFVPGATESHDAQIHREPYGTYSGDYPKPVVWVQFPLRPLLVREAVAKAAWRTSVRPFKDHTMSKQLQEALNSANNKWVQYEQEYILPCFDLAKESGIDLRDEVSKNAGTNCVVLLVKLLQAQVKQRDEVIEQLQKDLIQSKDDLEPLHEHFRDD